MGVATSSLVNPTRTNALMVRLAPPLVEAICELARAVKDKSHAQTEISGLLFGTSQDGLATVEALKTFKEPSGPRSDLARRERMERAFTAAMTLANEDPEFSAYKLLGWFSLRGGGGLINSDVDFHSRHFKNAEEVGLIVWREGDTQITAELYAAVEVGKFTTEDYRWSSVRLSTELRHVSQPLDLVMRVRMNDDLYMRTYGVSDVNARKDFKDEWKKMADNAKRRLLSFLPGRGHSDEADAEDAPLPAPARTATRLFESRASFNGPSAEPSAAQPPPPLPKTAPAKPVWPPAATAPPPQPAAAAAATPRAQQAPPAADTRKKEAAAAAPSFDFNRAQRPKPPVHEVSGLPMVLPKHKPTRVNGTPWLSMALVFVAFSGLTFAFMALKSAGSGDGKLSQVMKVFFPGSDLELRAASHGDSLWVSWNRRNPAVAASTGAVLTVSDGPKHFERKLDPSQVADGEVKYTPVSGDVTFQLRVYGTDQSVALGSLRVLDATAPANAEANPLLDLSANQTPPPESNRANQEVAPAPPATTTDNDKPLVRNGEVAANSRLNVPAVPAPTVAGRDVTRGSKKSVETTKPAAAQTAFQQPAMVQQQQSPKPPPPSRTAEQQPPPAVSRPTTTHSGTGSPTQQQQTSSTAINGWDASLPEIKPTPRVQQSTQPVQQPAPPVQQQVRHPVTPPDSKTVDFIPPKVLLQVMPNTRSLTPGSITEVTRVEVEVHIDTGGHVQAARLTNPNVKTQLGSAATAAAKQWTFQPATLRGLPVSSDHTIVFEFRPEGQ